MPAKSIAGYPRRRARKPHAKSPPLRILFAAAEVQPFVKTGGLADMAGALPLALHQAGGDVRVVLPAYRAVLQNLRDAPVVATIMETRHAFRILQTRLPDTAVRVYLVDAPALFDRAGTPYQDERGHDWHDNPQRFACFCDAIEALSLDRAGLSWRPDVLHCNDWHTGLAPARLALQSQRPATVFTVHNMAYQGNFPRETFSALGLPQQLWSSDGLEFHGMVSFIKSGLAFADRLTTVSPAYAREITMPEYGCGLDGLLRHRADRLSGTLNGVDYNVWDPRRDPFIDTPYGPDRLAGKRANKLRLQEELGLKQGRNFVVLALISRLTQQKGIDLVLAALPELLRDETVQLIVLGSGDRGLEAATGDAARHYPGRVAVHIGHNEALAHRIQAGADMLLSPSRFEPCGLTHLYSMRYGTVPVVRNTGGLADTVVDANGENLRAGTATGFHFTDVTSAALLKAARRAVHLYHTDARLWRRIMHAAMKREFAWAHSAATYDALYRQLLPRLRPDTVRAVNTVDHARPDHLTKPTS